MTFLLGRLRCVFCGDAWRALWHLEQGTGRECPTCGRVQAGVPEGPQLEAARLPRFAGFAALRSLQVKQMQRYYA